MSSAVLATVNNLCVNFRVFFYANESTFFFIYKNGIILSLLFHHLRISLSMSWTFFHVDVYGCAAFFFNSGAQLFPQLNAPQLSPLLIESALCLAFVHRNSAAASLCTCAGASRGECIFRTSVSGAAEYEHC